MKKTYLIFALLMTMLALGAANGQAFVTTWKTDNPGPSNDNQITIPTLSGGGSFNYTVDWGDGTSDVGVTDPNPITHTYATAGTYTVSITGDFPRLFFNNGGDREKLLTIAQWGAIAWQGLNFYGCANLQITATDAPDLSNLTSLNNSFRNCTNLNASLNHWDVSSVLTMEFVFYNSPLFNGDISSWDVSNVTSLNGMFGLATNFNVDISGWNVGNVEDMSFLFSRASSFNQDLSSWDVSKVTNMASLFDRASSFNGDITTWDVSSVTNMSSIFSIAGSFNRDISAWDVSNVTSFNRAFNGAGNFNQDISSWNMSSANNTARMFLSAIDFNQDVSNWDVSNVTRMEFMFFNAQSFNQDLGQWNVGMVTHMDQMIEQTGITIANYDNLLEGWSQLTLQSNVSFGAAGKNYCHGADGRGILTGAPNNWIITDNGQDCPPFITTWKTDNPGTSNDNQITIPAFGGNSPNFDVDWGDGMSDLGVTGAITHTYAAPGTYTVSITGDFTGISFGNTGDKDKLLTVEQWGSINTWALISFYGCSNLDVVASDAPDLSGVTTLSSAFRGCTNFNGDIGHWNTSNVRTLQNTFNGASSFNQDLSAWDVSSVTNMRDVFNNASSFNQDLNDWDVSSVTNMNRMFLFATNFNGQIGDWDVSNVTDMGDMFRLSSFNQDIGQWNVSNVVTMLAMFSSTPFDQDIGSWNMSSVVTVARMFEGTPFNQDISTWNMANAENFSGMFINATEFNQDIGGWNCPNCLGFGEMFMGATSFNQDLSAWNTSAIIFMFNMFDGATAFDQDLGSWDIGMVTSMENMLDGSGLSNANYDQTLQGWAAQTVQPGVTLGAAGVEYCLGAASRDILTGAPNSWIITDGGENCILDIPDTNFKAALLANTSINTVDDGEITLQEAQAFAGTLDVVNLNIADATGIEAFVNLDELNISLNNLTSLNVVNNTALTSLRIGGNPITSIDVSQNTQLTDFIVSDCPISTLDVSNNPLLITFTASNNLISTLDLSNNGGLTTVAVYDQPDLTEIDLRNSNNENINSSINLSGNPMLTCVSVNDRVLALNEWTNVDDPAVFKFTCDPNDIVNIPDANFKAALLADTEINTTDDGEITYGEAEAFTGRMSVFNSSIGDFVGLEAFYNLTELVANANTATTLDTRNNTELTMLEVFNVPLISMDLSGNTKLEWLQFGGNSVFNTLDLSNNTELSLLVGSESSALNAVLGIENLTQLSTLRLENNDLMSLDLRNGNNEQITDVRLGGNANLTCISVDDPIFSTENWTNVDPASSFSFSCDPSEIVTIPDANFKAALLANTSINTIDDGEITYGEAEAFTGIIDVENLGIAALTGIEAFANLTQLDANRNDLTSVDLAYNTALTHVFLWTNDLETIDLSRNTAITNLNLNSNQLMGLDVSNQANLFTLQCQSCGLTNLDVSSNADVQFLLLNNNDLSSLDVSNNPDLHTLNIPDNNLSSLDLTSNIVLQALDARNNSLTAVDLRNGNNTGISSVSLSGNSLLTCINVDDVAYAESNFTDIDGVANFSTECSNISTDILTFSFAEEVSTTINDVDHTITSEVALTSDLTNLVPTFTISSGASVDQASGIAQDFSSPFTYTVTAENPSAVQEWVVTVFQGNVAPTDILLSDATITENNQINDVIGLLSSVDANSADTHSYSLAAGTGDDDNASFAISGDQLIAGVVFDFEVQATYSIRVESTDGNGGTFQKMFTISIVNTNESITVVNPLEDLVLDQGFGTTDIDLSNVFNDEDGDDLTYTVSTSNMDVATGSVSGAMLTVAEVGLGTATITVTADDGSGETNSDEFSVTIDEVVGLETEVNLQVFPNPTSDYLRVNSDHHISIRLLDLNGRELSGGDGKSVMLNLASFPKGIYMLVIREGSRSTSQRIIKK